MPKRGHDYPAQLSFGVSAETRARIRALAYLTGNKEYADKAREIIEAGLDEVESRLSDRQRGQYERILPEVRQQETLLKDIRDNKPRQVPNRIGNRQ